MKKLTLILSLLFATTCLSYNAGAQMIKDPTNWSYEVKKKNATEYELVFHLNLEGDWHIWSVKPGGDGMQIAPTFKFDKNATVQVKGMVKELGKAKTEKIDGIDGAVTSLSGKVDYVQTISVKGKTKITGSHEYQVCNESVCLPPKTKKFEFVIN